MKVLKIILMLIFSHVVLFAQQTKTEFSRRPLPDPKIRNLKIGDPVPEIFISKIIRNDKPSAKISEFKNQLLILDFWDTYCGSCIEALPKLDSLQKKFGSKIKILPVTYQSEEVMNTFFKTNRLVKRLQLPCVVEDKLLGSHFQYKLISHEVWIYKGIVVALTGTDYVTAENIQAILDGKKVEWPVKNDMVIFDKNKPLFMQTESDQFNSKNGFLKHSGITGHREGIDYRGNNLQQVYDSVGNYYRTSFYNYSIIAAFNMVTFKIKPRTFLLSPGRTVLEVKDSSKYIYDKTKGFPSDWNRENEICYELITAKPMEEKARTQYILDDLNHILGLNTRWEKRPVKCLVLIKRKEINNLDSINNSRQSIGGTTLPMASIPVFFFDQEGKYPPGIDETGFKGKVVIAPFQDIDGLREQLTIYGCDVIEAEREIEVMVITENDYMK